MTRGERERLAALFAAILPRPTGISSSMPSMAEVDLDAFWPRFEATAPATLIFALRSASLTIGVIFPRLSGTRGDLVAESEESRERLLAKAATLPGLRDLLEVLKLVACLAYFDDPRAQAALRREELG